MKFSDRSALERTAIAAWIRVSQMVRENECLKISDDFTRMRQKDISETPGDIGKMMGLYADYQSGKKAASYTEYFQVSHPQEYAAMVVFERAQVKGGF